MKKLRVTQWDIVLETLPIGTPRYCCICEGHDCELAAAKHKKCKLISGPEAKAVSAPDS